MRGRGRSAGKQRKTKRGEKGGKEVEVGLAAEGEKKRGSTRRKRREKRSAAAEVGVLGNTVDTKAEVGAGRVTGGGERLAEHQAWRGCLADITVGTTQGQGQGAGTGQE